MAERRYPLDPLLALDGWTMHRVTRIAPCSGTEYRLRRDQGVTERTAERLALTAGLHPHNVWPEMAEHALEDADRADQERRERRREAWRRHEAKRMQDPAYRAAKAEYLRRYREQSRKAARATSRRYYEANRERILARQREYDRTVRAERRRQQRDERAA